MSAQWERADPAEHDYTADRWNYALDGYVAVYVHRTIKSLCERCHCEYPHFFVSHADWRQGPAALPEHAAVRGLLCVAVLIAGKVTLAAVLAVVAVSVAFRLGVTRSRNARLITIPSTAPSLSSAPALTAGQSWTSLGTTGWRSRMAEQSRMGF